MKIKLIKATDAVGDITFQVVVDESYADRLTQFFGSEKEAIEYYEKIKNDRIEPKEEILKSETI